MTPEAQEGGAIALVQDGDVIDIDYSKKEINIVVDDEVLAHRLQVWKQDPKPYKVQRGTLYKYIKVVQSASLGCVTDE